MATHRCCPKTKEVRKLKKSLHDVSGRLEASTVLCGGGCQFDVVSVSLVSSVVSVASVKSFLEVPKVRTQVGRYISISRSCFLPQHRKNATCLFFLRYECQQDAQSRGRT